MASSRRNTPIASAFAVYFRALETDADMALGREIVDLGRPDLLHQADQVGGIRHIPVMQEKRHVAFVRILVEMIDPGGVERGRTPLDAMDGIAEAEQVLRQIGPVPTGDTGDQRNHRFESESAISTPATRRDP